MVGAFGFFHMCNSLDTRRSVGVPYPITYYALIPSLDIISWAVYYGSLEVYRSNIKTTHSRKTTFLAPAPFSRPVELPFLGCAIASLLQQSLSRLYRNKMS